MIWSRTLQQFGTKQWTDELMLLDWQIWSVFRDELGKTIWDAIWFSFVIFYAARIQCNLLQFHSILRPLHDCGIDCKINASISNIENEIQTFVGSCSSDDWGKILAQLSCMFYTMFPKYILSFRQCTACWFHQRSSYLIMHNALFILAYIKGNWVGSPQTSCLKAMSHTAV